jgi:hypothetical protein
MAERTSQGLTLAIDADAPPKRAVDVALGNDPALPRIEVGTSWKVTPRSRARFSPIPFS